MKTCSEDQLLGHLGVILYEYLGEEVNQIVFCFCLFSFIHLVSFIESLFLYFSPFF